MNHEALTFLLHAAGHSVDRGHRSGQTKPLFLQLALLPLGSLLEDLDHSVLLKELGVKCPDPEHMEYDFSTHNPRTHKLVSSHQ